jgi:hypothetical protein
MHLADDTMVGFSNPRAPYGAMAERTVVSKEGVVPAPEDIDPAVTAVLASAVTGFATRWAAGFTPGETVLSRARRGSRAGLRSRWRGCSAPGGSWPPDATTTRFGR